MSDDKNPTVVPDAQRYDWRKDLQWVPRLDVSESFSAWSRLAAHIESLEAERDALLAEHEVYPFLNRTAWQAAHDNAEKVIRGE